MGKLRRPAAVALAAVGGYLLLLVGLSYTIDGCVAERVEQRLAAALDAEVEVGAVSLDLLRGHIEVADVEVRREHYGRLELRIEQMQVDTAPLGWAVVNRDPGFVTVTGVDLVMTGAGAVALPERPKREPLRIGGMQLGDIHVRAAVSEYLPGLGQVELQVTEARTGPLVMSSVLDWVFALRALSATLALPAGIDAGVYYTPGELGLSGSVFGSKPLVMPFTMPVPDADALDSDKLKLLARAILDTVGERLAQSWLRARVEELLD